VRFDKVSGLLELIRWQGRGLRSDYTAGQGLMEICYTATELRVPVEFISAGLCVLEAAAASIGASMAAVRPDFPEVIAYQDEAEGKNRADQAEVVRQLEAMNLVPEQVLLLGDSAVLLGLYGTVRAFRVRNCAIGLPGHAGVGEQSIVESMLTARPVEVSFGRLGRLEGRLDRLSRVFMFDGTKWRVPSPELLVVMLAARVGEPEASPESPAWAHLAAMLKGGRDRIEVDEVLDLAEELELAPRVHRGLAIVRVLFPELGRMIPAERLEIPAWERVALRLAANKLVQAAIGEEE
jgi:hypothetical protein